ncbi:hypothetical protein [Desulfosporosinus hippei]|uniref:Predicted nucleotide-binding protein, sugar kinase/HSP70/actin superfamily n=1 Tax=Desulfosporosinus hippei DSM 8344 TaxID=1121419 RepID=A0A1G7UER0_9FIRM|nr:hypothetical protein [Desulfosporosinus hippei]SDG45927.1 Predicted nucleotide-binding protein, sugar kinase/HSP70/actin superfamily [Desulfosporosinus hippei DSM 8344]
MEEIKASYPQLGNYCTPLELLFTEGFDVKYIVPPPITKKTLALGSRYSPDYVCAPFKYHLGNFIETIEAGANTLVQTGGVCRLQYYGELHEQILQDLGYRVHFVNMSKVQDTNPLTFYNGLKEINPQMSLQKIGRILPVVLKMFEYIDEAENFIRKNIGFESSKGAFEKVHAAFLGDLRTVRNKKELKSTYRDYMKLFKGIEINKPTDPLKVGIVGEYYTIMEPFSNHYLEKELARMGIVVDRWMNVTNTLIHYPKKQIQKQIKDYAEYPWVATSMATIDRALEFARKGYDGIIHVKSFGCTPEIDAMPILQNISKDYKIPILYFTFDTQTSETGVNTRLEAFYDMIIMRKETKK